MRVEYWEFPFHFFFLNRAYRIWNGYSKLLSVLATQEWQSAAGKFFLSQSKVLLSVPSHVFTVLLSPVSLSQFPLSFFFFFLLEPSWEARRPNGSHIATLGMLRRVCVFKYYLDPIQSLFLLSPFSSSTSCKRVSLRSFVAFVWLLLFFVLFMYTLTVFVGQEKISNVGLFYFSVLRHYMVLPLLYFNSFRFDLSPLSKQN